MHVIRRTLLFALLLLLPALAFAQPKIAPPDGRYPLLPKYPGRNGLPADFTPHPCAPKTGCVSFPNSDYPSAAFSFLGLELSGRWVSDNETAMLERLAPTCGKIASCLATPGNSFAYCTDSASAEMRTICPVLHPRAKDPKDYDQCTYFIEIYALGVDQHAKQLWEDAQACSAKLPRVQHTRPPDIWMVPDHFSADYRGNFIFYALDPDTHITVPATVYIDGNGIYAPANPNGLAQAPYPFKWPVVFRRVPNAAGHTDLARPIATFKTDGYPDVNYELDVEMHDVIVEMTPPASQLHEGDNTITVTAKDAVTGQPVEMRVNFGDIRMADTNAPFVWTKEKGTKTPEIWVTSLFNRYNDKVIAPAEK